MSCSKRPYRTQWMALCAMRAIIRKCQGQNVTVPTGAYLCSPADAGTSRQSRGLRRHPGTRSEPRAEAAMRRRSKASSRLRRRRASHLLEEGVLNFEPVLAPVPRAKGRYRRRRWLETQVQLFRRPSRSAAGRVVLVFDWINHSASTSRAANAISSAGQPQGKNKQPSRRGPSARGLRCQVTFT